MNTTTKQESAAVAADPSASQHVRLIKYHQDPGHGWIEVQRAELDAMGLSSKISGYSYLHAGTAYLEEDCDAPLFLKALEDAGQKVRLCPLHKDFDHPIRCMQRFKT